MTSRTPDLQRFFAPRSVALVGATDDMTKFGGRVLYKLQQFGYAGRIFPVNPRRSEIQGLACYPSITDLPETPDHVAIVVPTENVLAVLEECHARGVPFATVYSAGFSEMGTPEGSALQAELTRFARTTDLRFMGPNCNGLINFVDGVALSSTGAISHPRRPAGTIGVVAQSGGLGQINVMWRAQQAGLEISYSVSGGNEADLEAADYARFMIESETTEIVLMALEAVRDGAKFLEVAELAAEREKPIVVLKFGRTELGSRAAASHTGAMTGTDEIFDAAFRQFGLIRVRDCCDLYDVAMGLRRKRWPKGRRAASLSLSGGNVVQMVDCGADLGLEWSEFTPATQAQLGALMPGYGKVSNPTDMTALAAGKTELFRNAIDVISRDENVDVMIPLFTMANKSELDQAVALARESSKPFVILWTGGCFEDEALTTASFVRMGIPAYRDTLACLQAVRAAIGYGEYLEAFRRRDSLQRPAGIDGEAARARLRSNKGGLLTERESKQVLAAYGLPVTAEKLAQSAGEAVAHARAIGMPVALKIDSPDIPHKTEAGAIRLDLSDEPAVERAYHDVLAAAYEYRPNAKINGVLVQQMAAPGVEMILGVVKDAVFGPVIAVGMGGVYVEVLHDVAYRLPPFDESEAMGMLRELRGYKLLGGVRGRPECKVDALVDAIVRLSWLAHDLRDEILELDVNPLIVSEHGVCAADALLVRS